MSKISRFIFGACLLSIPKDSFEKVSGILIGAGIPFGRMSEEDGEYTVCLTRRGFRRYTAICNGLSYGEKAKEIGLLALLCRYRLRTGMFIGILLFALCICLSSMFIWDINVTGNVSITEEEILSRLDAYGFRLGTFKNSVDTKDICQRIVLEAGNLSFMSVNVRGTVATIVVRERNDDTVAEEDSSPSNLISGYDAQIERVEVFGGVCEVKHLQTVRKGELLISGVIDSQALGYRLVRARGNVYGKATLFFEACVPFEQSQKTETGAKIEKKSIKFFSKSLNLSKNTIIPYEKYDTIVKERKIFLFGIIELPIFITTTIYKEYEETTVTLSRNDAYRKALHEVNEQSDKELFGADILSKSLTLLESEEGLSLSLAVECVLNIAKEVKIETARR
ncbi:MAG: sporulation protein YqfD [Clostridia bacterium]|nr:sporulation protein YqfD [Clostridia bacterium]